MFVYLYKADMYFAGYDTLSVPQGLMYFLFRARPFELLLCNNILCSVFHISKENIQAVQRLYQVIIHGRNADLIGHRTQL